MVNSFRTCQWCGAIYTYMGKPFCPKCIKQMDEDFQVVKKYLYENPGAGVEEVSEETEVDPKVIIHFLREGRLEMKNADGTITCEKCGKPITSGSMCQECKNNLSSTLNKVLPKVEPKQKMSRLDAMSSKSKLHVDVNKK